MFSMFKTMTIRTEYYQVILGIIFPVFIYMMNAQNFRMNIITALFTIFDQTPNFIPFSYTGVRRFPNFMMDFSLARIGAKFSFFKSFIVLKIFSAKETFKFRRRLSFGCSITKYATKFSLLPGGSIKFIITKLALKQLIHKEILCH